MTTAASLDPGRPRHGRDQPRPLGAVLLGWSHESDAEMAALIRKDARRRHAAGERLSLSDYLRVVADLRNRPVVLDAAISAAVGQGIVTIDEQRGAAERERARHPELAPAIELALCLDGLVGQLRPAPQRARDGGEPFAPMELGSALADGRPRYRTVETLGRGSHGVVYLAEDRLFAGTSPPPRVAIKVQSRAGEDASHVERVIGEALRARSVEHPNLVRVLDFGQNDTCVFIVQEWVQGETLENWMGAGENRVSLRRVIGVMRQVAAAMDAVHAGGIVHADLKPRNILVMPGDVAKIIDFGEADERHQHAPPGGPRPRRDQRGTLAFVSPQRFSRQIGCGAPATDIYSLGAILYWACTGLSPHGRSTLEALAYLSRLAHADGPATPPPRAYPRGVSRTIRRIIDRALAPSPKDRYSSAGLLAADLDSWLRRRPIAWQRPGALRRTGLLVRRHPLGAVLACGCAALVGVAGLLRAEAVESDRIAGEKAHVAALEQVRLDAATSWRKKSAEQLSQMLSKFMAAKNKGLEAEILTSLWILEWVHGPMLLETPESINKLWDARVEVLERARRDLHEHGLADSIEAQLIVPSLALWYIRTARASEAEDLLASSESYWLARTTDEDPWVEQIRVLRSAARLSMHEHARGLGAPDDHPAPTRNEEQDLATLKSALHHAPADAKPGPIVQLAQKIVARYEAHPHRR